MRRFRIIPALLLRGSGLVKTVQFKDPKYVGDPINAIRIFNEKEVDELIFLDIEATRLSKPINLPMLRDIASECFMPLCYGGGVRTPQELESILRAGVEKVAINTALYSDPDLVRFAAAEHGSSTIVASIDFKRGLIGKNQVMTHGGTRGTGKSPLEAARMAEDLGVGEILLNSIDRDGTMKGYDLATIETVSREVSVPVIAAGGAGSFADLRAAVAAGHASAAAAGAMFVFHGKHRAVLITYPTPSDLAAQVYF